MPNLGDPLKKVILLLAALCCAVLVFNSLAQTTQPGASDNFSVLTADSGTNISVMNATFTTSPAIAVGQAVKFQPPKAGWKLKLISIMATDGWNSSVKTFPTPLPFTIEIRDKDLNLLYHYADTQLPYFTHPDLITMADIEVPAMPMSGEFYVCFYGYGQIALMTELQNSTGNCYYYVMPTGQLAPAELQLENNSTLPVNWIIRAAGQ
jgi:hypothetical protein